MQSANRALKVHRYDESLFFLVTRVLGQVMEPSRSVQDLLQAMAAGDQQALRALWQQWAANVQMFVRMQLAPCGEEANSLAQEVTADVFHEIWLAPLRYDGRVAFNTWLYAVARNKAVDCARKRNRRLQIEQQGDDEDLHAVPDQAPGPEAQLNTAQDKKAVLYCLKRLRNPLQREALLLWAVEDMHVADIAQTQQCPENTVKTRLFHGRKNLRVCLQQWLGLELV